MYKEWFAYTEKNELRKDQFLKYVKQELRDVKVDCSE